MVDEASCWSPAGQRHIECIGGQLRAQVIGERPTHDATAERVQDDRQIQRDSYSLRLQGSFPEGRLQYRARAGQFLI